MDVIWTLCLMMLAGQQQGAGAAEHPWETRLKRVEAGVAQLADEYRKSVLKAQNFSNSTSDHVKNHRERLELLERWVKAAEAQLLGAEQSARQTAEEAAERVATTKAAETAVEATQAQHPWLIALGGASGVGAIAASAVGYFLRRLRLEIESGKYRGTGTVENPLAIKY